MASDRVELFLDTCQTLIIKLNNNKKIISEISKLCIWLQKHQNEEITDTAKGKIIIIIEKYYLYYKNSSNNNNNNNDDNDIIRLEDTIEKLLSDYLALPEGKLVTGKFKQKVMNWQSSMQQQNNISNNSDNISNNNNIERWIICDINDNKITLMKPDSNINDEIIDDVIINDSNILKIINNIYNQEESSNYIQVDYDKKLNIIIKLYDENGNEIH